MNILSFATGCLPIPERLRVRRPSWDPKNPAGRMGGRGLWLGLPRDKGQRSNPASGKPGLLQASS